jgi:exopolysaccharide biosynthesis polyprenyl glycosylphosphotransferase
MVEMKDSSRANLVTASLIVSDSVALAASWLVVWKLRQLTNSYFGPINELAEYIPPLLALVPVWVLICAFHGHYSHRERISSLNEITRIFRATEEMWLATFVLSFMLKSYHPGRSVVLLSVIPQFVYLYTSRTILRAIKRRATRRGKGLKRVLIVGTGETARRALLRIVDHPEIGYELVGLVGRADEPLPRAINHVSYLGTLDQLRELIRTHRIEEVFLADPKIPDDDKLNLVARCDETGVSFKIVSQMFEVTSPQIRIDVLDDLPVIPLQSGGLGPVQAFVKRAMDFVLAAVLLVLSAPFALFIAIWIRLDSPGPAFFTHGRIGRHGVPFLLWKFRTMTTETHPYDTAPTDPNDPRITRAGRWLRRFSLDELPQLWNVLRGEMSMVGPRPEMPHIVARYEPWQRIRLEVKPGVTGLWQIIGRKNLPLELNLEYDLYYIKNQSLILDLVILLKTIPAVVFGRGAY